MSVRPLVGIDFGSGWSLTGAVTFFWRQSLKDGIYGTALNLLRPAGGSRARDVGDQAEIGLGCRRTATWASGLSIRFSGPARSSTTPGLHRLSASSGCKRRSHSRSAAVQFAPSLQLKNSAWPPWVPKPLLRWS
jgi:hypothetical protein